MSSITSIVETPARRSIAQTCDDIALLLLAAIAIIASLTFKRYGLGWDDYTHAEYAELLLQLYGSGFTDKSALSFVNLYMYGGGFDMAAALLHKILPLELFETRRLVGAFVGVLGIALTWRLGRRVGGPVAGLATLVLITVCPAFYGHHLHEPEGHPVRDRDGRPDAGSRPSGRRVSAALAAHGADRRPRRRPGLGCRILGGFALIYAAIGAIPLLMRRCERMARAKRHTASPMSSTS